MLLLFSLSLFVSATLLFVVQPLFAKMVLPLLGGTPAVWNTCMVFYQAALLAGYAYAHLAIRWLGVRRQALVHLVLLLLVFLTLPIAIREGWTPPTAANPIPWLFLLLLISVGLAFFVVSTTAPLLQRWFAATGHPAARDPYFLYVASNLGSMLALLAYPVLLEPFLRLKTQSLLWTCGYGVLVLLIAGCAACLYRNPAASQSPDSPPEDPSGTPEPFGLEKPTAGRRLRWVLLALAPSSLMLGLTSYVTTDIAAVPLLWVIPLALYLLTFVIVFARRPLIPHRVMVRVQPFLVIPLVLLFAWQSDSTFSWLILGLHLAVFFAIAMVCHGELAQTRPPTAYLTEFYLWMAVGGVLGGLFNALVAPLVFNSIAEYPLVIILACLLRPSRAPEPSPLSRILDFALPLGLGALLAGLILRFHTSPSELDGTSTIIAAGTLAMVCYSFRNRPLRFGLALGAIMVAGIFSTADQDNILLKHRSFFGVITVSQDADYRYLMHGTTLHGAQSREEARRREPLTYYTPQGPIGQLMSNLSPEGAARRVAVVGLGTGTLASYGEPGQQFTFYEIDPAMVSMAWNPRYFSYLRDSRARVEVVLGDGRLSLARAPDHHYSMIFLDAFSSDAVPVHLLTREALRLYLAKLTDHGVLVFNATNRYINLLPVLANLARDAGLVGLYQYDDTLSEEEQAELKSYSKWVVMARRGSDLDQLAATGHWQHLRPPADKNVWTDDYSDIISHLIWKKAW